MRYGKDRKPANANRLTKSFQAKLEAYGDLLMKYRRGMITYEEMMDGATAAEKIHNEAGGMKYKVDEKA